MKRANTSDGSHAGRTDSFSFSFGGSRINSRRLKVSHITQGHPGIKQNSNSNSDLTAGLCAGKASIL